MKFFVFALTCLIALSGCAVQRSSIASRAQTEMVGMSKKDLLMCAGVPEREEKVDDMEFLTYTGGGDTRSVGVVSATSSNTAVGVTAHKHRYCEATFVLKDGVVQKVNYNGRTGGLATRGEQCAFIVENCIQ